MGKKQIAILSASVLAVAAAVFYLIAYSPFGEKPVAEEKRPESPAQRTRDGVLGVLAGTSDLPEDKSHRGSEIGETRP